MSTPLACPSCRSPVDIPAGHDGGSINCGICWAEVAVPAALVKPKPASAKPVVAKAVPVAPPPVKAAPLPQGAKPAPGMAKLDALVQKAAARAAGPDLQGAEPVVAEVVPAPAAKPKPTLVVAKALPAPAPAPAPVAVPLPAPGKPKFRTRDEDDEDRDEKPAKKAGGKGLLIGLLVGGFVLLAGGAAALYAGYKYLNTGDPATDAAGNIINPLPNNAPGVNPNPLPQFNVPPVADLPGAAPPLGGPGGGNGNGMPRIPPPAPERPRLVFPDEPWAPVAGANGFEASLPGRVSAFNTWSENLFDPDRLTLGQGAKYISHDKGYNFEITYADAPAGTAPDLAKIAAGPFRNGGAVRATKHGDHAAQEMLKDDGQSRVEVRRVFQVGCRVFILSANQTAMFGRDRDHLLENQKKFFDGFKVTFDPATPAPPNPFGPRVPAVPPGGRNAGADPEFPLGGELRTAAKLEPFWSAVFLPKANEVWTFGSRFVAGGRPAGVLRRYTYPGFTAKNTYYLPFPVTYAVADEAAGKLAVAVLTKPDVSVVERERNVALGDVQVYDLAPVLQGKLAERDELKPAAAAGFTSKIAGVAKGPAGTVAVLSLTHQPANRAKPWLAKLSQVALATGQVVKKLELPDPAWRLVVGPNDMAYCAEVPLSIAGAPLLGAAKTGTVLAVDLAAFTKDRTVTFPGVVVDFDVAADGTLLAAVSAGPELKLVAAPPGGGTVELTPANAGRAAYPYVALTPDGKRLVGSNRPGNGVEISDVTDLANAGGVQRKGRWTEAGVPPAPIGGGFIMTPDGKYAMFQTGAVIELTAVK